MVPAVHASTKRFDVSDQWVVSAKEARTLIEQGAIVLDTRVAKLIRKNPLPNSVKFYWDQVTKPDVPYMGLLRDDVEMAKTLEKFGITKDKPIIVVADLVNDWPGDGKVVIALRTMGHPQVVMIDGGYQALVKDGVPTIQKPRAPGKFTITRTTQWSLVSRDEVLNVLRNRPNVVVLDVREPREFKGKTPYGESRGGHVPWAKFIWYKDLMPKDGTILPRHKVVEKLLALGVSEDSEVITYCTGGVRSGWVAAVLNNYGITARNYEGSMWDWAAGDPELYPLVEQ